MIGEFDLEIGFGSTIWMWFRCWLVPINITGVATSLPFLSFRIGCACLLLVFPALATLIVALRFALEEELLRIALAVEVVSQLLNKNAHPTAVVSAQSKVDLFPDFSMCMVPRLISE